MGRLFEEIDAQITPLGEISLRRRRIPAVGDRDIYEVKLNDEFLMSSLFVEAEVALADLALKEVDGAQLQVVVGGLGLGYTAEAALRDARIVDLIVVEALQPVIDWHRQGRVPIGEILNADARCRFVCDSFFRLASGPGLDPEDPDRLFDAILLDIDHSPSAHLNATNAGFYTAESLGRMARQIKPGGVFGLWSNDAPDGAFIDELQQVFAEVEAKVVSFYNPFQEDPASNTIYLARR
ncbi:spermidine synthase [Gilvimarinus sp. F26214L]|uniref:spermidine synthase n=1 Tax=Gilvimarinus sp. DZF01 TaxID=3461371 RepID=UPI004045E455